MVNELVELPPRSFGSIISEYVYYASLWVIPLAIVSFLLYKVFRKEEFSTAKKFGIILIFLVLYCLFGIGHTFVIGDNNFFEELINHSVKDAFSIAFLWPSIYGTFLIGAQIAGGILLAIIAWLSYWIGTKIFK